MGKTGKWLKSFLTGKKEKNKEKDDQKGDEKASLPSPHKHGSGPVPGPSPKEKKRWSFRRYKELNTADAKFSGTRNCSSNGVSEEDIEKTRQAIAVAVAASLARGQRMSNVGEDEAAIKIQSYFRAYLSRKALCALRGLVLLQALIRGNLVRRHATEALRRMQALMAAQGRIRAQRIQMVEQEQAHSISSHTPNQRRSPLHSRSKQSYEVENSTEDNIKIVVMDMAEPRRNPKRDSYSSIAQFEKFEHTHSLQSYGSRTPTKSDIPYNYSPARSGLTDFTPKGQSDHYDDFSFKTAQSSPQYNSATSNGFVDYPLYPNYMSYTQSSRAKVRSHSAPRQRHETYERQPSRRKLSIEGRNIPRGVKMQRSISQAGMPVNGLQFPWHLKVDRSSVSVIDNEYGSCSSSGLTDNNYCRSLAAYEVYGANAYPNAITE